MSAKRIVLGVTGGVAAYKSADLVRRLREAGADVRVVMTRGGQAFVTPLTFQAVSGHPVHTTLLDDEAVCVLNSDCPSPLRVWVPTTRVLDLLACS